MPCLSSGRPWLKPSVPRSSTNQEGPAGALARIVYLSAMPPLLIHCLRPFSRYPVTEPSVTTGVAVVLSAARSLPASGSVAP